MDYLVSILVIVLVARLIFKKYLPQGVLLMGGLVLIFAAVLLNGEIILSDKISTGFIFFDAFEYIKNTFSKNVAGLGLIIMSVAGFAKYMDKIGASSALVNMSIKPVKKLNSPYLVLALSYIIGQFLNIFIPSASGLGVLLMTTVYPILIALGISPLSATAVIGTTACLDLGPGSGNSILAAETAGMDVSIYFIQHQLPVSLVVITVISVLHYIVQKRADSRLKVQTVAFASGTGEVGNIKVVTSSNSVSKINNNNNNNHSNHDKKVPKLYSLLPILPLFFILTFSPLLINTIKVNVVTAMFMSVFISMIAEFIRHKDLKKVLKSLTDVFDAMGVQFAKVITLIVAGQTFAYGLKKIGLISSLIEVTKEAGLSVQPMIIIMTLIIVASSILMGSGNAPFFAFAALVPNVATSVGISPVLMLLPMQLAAGVARSVSPITSVIVAVSGISEVSPFDVVKRTAIPMTGGILAILISNFIF
jgi:DcuC family C4-dicarboxylate transporter